MTDPDDMLESPVGKPMTRKKAIERLDFLASDYFPPSATKTQCAIRMAIAALRQQEAAGGLLIALEEMLHFPFHTKSYETARSNARTAIARYTASQQEPPP